jgi:hypothetical protein
MVIAVQMLIICCKVTTKSSGSSSKWLFRSISCAIKDHAGVVILEKDEFIKGNTTQKV